MALLYAGQGELCCGLSLAGHEREAAVASILEQHVVV